MTTQIQITHFPLDHFWITFFLFCNLTFSTNCSVSTISSVFGLLYTSWSCVTWSFRLFCCTFVFYLFIMAHWPNFTDDSIYCCCSCRCLDGLGTNCCHPGWRQVLASWFGSYFRASLSNGFWCIWKLCSSTLLRSRMCRLIYFLFVIDGNLTYKPQRMWLCVIIDFVVVEVFVVCLCSLSPNISLLYCRFHQEPERFSVYLCFLQDVFDLWASSLITFNLKQSHLWNISKNKWK